MNHTLTVSIAIVAIGSLAGSSRPAPSSRSVPSREAITSRFIAPETRSFVFVMGNDTGGRETFTRTADLLSGDMVLGKARVHYEARIAADGTIPRLDIRASRSGAGAQTPRLISAIVARDSVQIIEHLGRKADTLRLSSQPGVMPFINPSMGMMELIVARARSQKSRTATIPNVLIDALNTLSPPTAALRSRAVPGAANVAFMSADTVMLGNAREKDQMRVVVGSDGRIRGAVSGANATDHFSIRPTSKPLTLRQ